MEAQHRAIQRANRADVTPPASRTTTTAAAAVFLFAFAVEAAQAAQIVERFSLADILLARIIIGTTFSWGDVVAHAAGAILCAIFGRR